MKTIDNSHGHVEYDWKTDLHLEEGEDYLPVSCKKILELGYIEAAKLSAGNGTELMNEFLATHEALSADLIFCDPNPGQGLYQQSRLSKKDQLAKLIAFYKKFGFLEVEGSFRMWKIVNASIKPDDLPG